VDVVYHKAAEVGVGLAIVLLIYRNRRSIDITEVGHAAPFFADLDGDGKRDLLVGQFGGGKLRIYKNQGTDREPRFAKYDYMKAGADLGTVPAS